MEVDDDMQWFRWWHDATTDGKLLRLPLQHRWLWIALLTLASKSPNRGRLYVSGDLPCDINDVSREANMAPNICQAGIELMMRPQFKMLDVDENGAWLIVNWDKRQPKRDDTNLYTKEHRKRITCNAGEMHSDTESETETDNTPLTPQTGRNVTTELSPEAHTLAKDIYEWLKAQNALPASKGWYMKQVGIAHNLLLPVRSVDEWLACLAWAKTEPYWSVKLRELGQLGSSVWSQYARSGAERKNVTTTPQRRPTELSEAAKLRKAMRGEAQ